MSGNDDHRMKSPGGKGLARRSVDDLGTGKTDTEMQQMGKEWPRRQKNKGGGVSERFKDGPHMGESMTPNQIASYIEDSSIELVPLFEQYVRSTNCVTFNEFREYAEAYGLPIADERILVDLMEANGSYAFTEHADAQGKYWTPAIMAEEEEQASDDKAKFCTKCYTKHKPSAGCKSKNESRRRHKALTEEQDYEVEEPHKHARKFSSQPYGDDDTEAGPGSRMDDELGDEFGDEFGDEMGGEFGDGMDGEMGGEMGGEFGGEMGGEFGDEFGGEMDGEMGGEFGGEMGGCPECGGEMDEYGACPECGYEEGGESLSAGYGAEMPPEAGHYEDDDPEDEPDFIPPSPGRRTKPGGTMEGRGRRGGLTGRVLREDGMPTYKASEGAPADHGGHRMDPPGGCGLSDKKPKKSSGLPQEPTDTTKTGKEWPRRQKNKGQQWEEFADSEHGEAADGFTSKKADLHLRTKQKNKGQQWQEFDGGGYGEAQMKVGGGPSGSGLGGGAKKMHENVERLSRHVTKLLRQYMDESGSFRRPGSYPVTFTIGAGEWVLPKRHNNLTEALVDAEELLQIFGPDNVSLEARYQDQDGAVLMRRMVPLIRVQSRGPVMAENRTLFRFPEIARDFADALVNEGKTCRAVSHNWGAAVTARIQYQAASRTYDAIREEANGPFG